ncbi:MAG: putative glycoside hydrolase [Gemmatimonadetes bacterium]|nr:putative glycoside hydrolase [Gemmatimonadota bacterium]
MTFSLVLAAALQAQSPAPAAVQAPAPARSPASAPAAPAAAAAAHAPSRAAALDTPIVRGLYVNRWAAQSARRMRQFIDLADRTEVNALVLDMKDEFGLNYESRNPALARNAGTSGKVRDLKALLDTLKAHQILAIARIVVFKDSVTARVNPAWTIRKADGGIWRDHKGLAWVNPYNRELWEYNLGVAEELAALGFPEVQFDYIRFPEPYRSLPAQVFPGASGTPKPQTIAEFLALAHARLGKRNVRTTADVFGLVTSIAGPLEVAQQWELLAPVSDVLLPMVYPSHYPRGAFGAARPNAEPYLVVHSAIKRARERNLRLGIAGRTAVRPWLQAFSIGKPEYTAAEVKEQMRATYDAGYEGWILWSPGSRYEPFVPALAPTLQPRAR